MKDGRRTFFSCLSRRGFFSEGSPCFGLFFCPGGLAFRLVFINLLAFLVLSLVFMLLNRSDERLLASHVAGLVRQGHLIASRLPDSFLGVGVGASVPKAAEADVRRSRVSPVSLLDLSLRSASPGLLARVYDREGRLLAQRTVPASGGGMLWRDTLPVLGSEKGGSVLSHWWKRFFLWFSYGNLPSSVAFVEALGVPAEMGVSGSASSLRFRELLFGSGTSGVTLDGQGQLILFAVLPLVPLQQVQGLLFLSLRADDVARELQGERFRMFVLFVSSVIGVVFLSGVTALWIVIPLRRLKIAAERASHYPVVQSEFPDFSSRRDEIGLLSGALSKMEVILCERMDAIEGFAADVAHELKTPLASLRNAIEMLPSVKEEGDRERLIRISQHDVRRLDRLINDVLEASRLDGDLAREAIDPVDMLILLQMGMEMVNKKIEGGLPFVRLVVEDSPLIDRPYIVNGNTGRLGRVMTNLLDNALSFSPPEGIVTIRLRRLAHEIDICVEDEGCGIHPGNLERLFDRFYTDRPAVESFGRNSGLGLSISRRIIESYGGRIWAENRKERTASGELRIKGARFIFRLPCLYPLS
ncbi:MAG: ATP-binding protein [Alphaproteobacteria bacterium]|nr:ATP-binding protein [Alphaproteobacteria bacterium]